VGFFTCSGVWKVAIARGCPLHKWHPWSVPWYPPLFQVSAGIGKRGVRQREEQGFACGCSLVRRVPDDQDEWNSGLAAWGSVYHTNHEWICRAQLSVAKSTEMGNGYWNFKKSISSQTNEEFNLCWHNRTFHQSKCQFSSILFWSYLKGVFFMTSFPILWNNNLKNSHKAYIINTSLHFLPSLW
jgi:hypothetical protein